MAIYGWNKSIRTKEKIIITLKALLQHGQAAHYDIKTNNSRTRNRSHQHLLRVHDRKHDSLPEHNVSPMRENNRNRYRNKLGT